MRKTLLFLLLLANTSFLIGQQRALPQANNSSSLSHRSVSTWDYEYDFQDTSLLQDMVFENIDGNTDAAFVTNFLELNFSGERCWLALRDEGANVWAGSNSSFDPTGQADRWMITPSIIVSEGAKIKWRAKSVQLDQTATSESYEVYISTTAGDSHDDFTQAPIYTETATPTSWDEKIIDLAAYADDTVYVAFRHTSNNQGILAIDDIRLGETTQTTEGMQGDFENAEDFSAGLSPWTTIDVDQSPTFVFSSITFPGMGNPMGFITFNPAETNPSLSNLSPHGGERMGACFGAIMPQDGGDGPNNDWLIAPKLEIAQNGYLEFWAKSITAQYALERFVVAVSTTNNNDSSFTQIISAGDYVEVDTAWTYYNYDLSAFAGQEVYVGINCVSEDAFVFCIDDIYIDAVTGFSETFESTIEIFPNPTSDQLHINNVQGQHITIFNQMGQVVRELRNAGDHVVFDLSEFDSSMYFVQFEKNGKVITQKVLKL